MNEQSAGVVWSPTVRDRRELCASKAVTEAEEAALHKVIRRVVRELDALQSKGDRRVTMLNRSLKRWRGRSARWATSSRSRSKARRFPSRSSATDPD